MKLHAALFVLLVAFGCDCGGDQPADGGERDGASPRIADSGGVATLDGAHLSDGSEEGDSSVAGDGAGLDASGPADGSPLDDPLSDFCAGQNTVVQVGGNGLCAGDVAEDTFQFALCSCGMVRAQSALGIDAFDSRVGPYGGANLIDDGNVGINGQLEMDAKLTVRGSTFVGGGGISVGAQSEISRNLFAAGDAIQTNSSASVGRNAFVDGDVAGRFLIAGDLTVPPGATVSDATSGQLGGQLLQRPIPAVRPCPCDLDEILDVSALTAWAVANNDNAARGTLTSTTWRDGAGPDVISLPCGRYYLEGIMHPRTLTIRAEGRTVLFVDGDLVTLGGLTLELADGAEIDLFVAGDLSIGAAARLGDQGNPSRVRTYVAGGGTITLNASSVFGGNLYAPRANVTFDAAARLFGALFANDITFTGAAEVHFDTSIRNAGEDCDPGPDPSDEDAGIDDSGAAADAGDEVDGGGDPDPGQGGQCSMCDQCPGNLGCVVPPGETIGMCLGCQSDLDCCAPLACVNGACLLPL